MDLNQLLHRHQLSLMKVDRASSPEERSAHSQFASDYAEMIRMARNELGAPASRRPSPNRVEIEQDFRRDELGPAECVTARVVLCPPDVLPYKVVLARDGKESSVHSFATMREAEAFIRHNMPAQAARSTLYDRESGEV